MTLEEQIKAVEVDLRGKLHRRDWHGVWDAASEISRLEALRDACLQSGRPPPCVEFMMGL